MHVSAAVRLMPSPPARVDSRNTLHSGSAAVPRGGAWEVGGAGRWVGRGGGWGGGGGGGQRAGAVPPSTHVTHLPLAAPSLTRVEAPHALLALLPGHRAVDAACLHILGLQVSSHDVQHGRHLLVSKGGAASVCVWGGSRGGGQRTGGARRPSCPPTNKPAHSPTDQPTTHDPPPHPPTHPPVRR